jgi:VWFA-related protein
MSSVRDAILAGLINHPDPERRRLVVALTDADDTKSITESSSIYDVARRSDTVLHIVVMKAPAGAMGRGPNDTAPRAFMRPRQTPEERKQLFDAALVTGGAVHGATADDVVTHRVNAVGTFKKVFEEFRQSYVLQYVPENVPGTGWHEIAVSVKNVDAKGVRARKGYFAGAQ